MSTVTDRPGRGSLKSNFVNDSAPCDGSRRVNARRRLERGHDCLPRPVRTLFDPLEPTFSRSVHRRFILLALAAILTLGGRTITNLLRVLDTLAPGHSCSYHHVFSRDRWSLAALSRRYISLILDHFAPVVPFSWPATTRSPNILALMSTARAAIVIRCARRTPTRRFAGDISGSCWPCWFPSPGPRDAGRSPFWSCFIGRRRRTKNTKNGTKHRPNCSVSWFAS